MKVGKHTMGAVSMQQILDAVAKDCAPGTRLIRNVNQDGGDRWFGYDLPAKVSGYAELARVVGVRRGDHLGWFGYQHHEGNSPQLAFWFYSDRGREYANRTHAWLKRQLPKSQTPIIDVPSGTVFFAVDADLIDDDRTWFTKMFDPLRDRGPVKGSGKRRQARHKP